MPIANAPFALDEEQPLVPVPVEAAPAGPPEATWGEYAQLAAMMALPALGSAGRNLMPLLRQATGAGKLSTPTRLALGTTAGAAAGAHLMDGGEAQAGPLVDEVRTEWPMLRRPDQNDRGGVQSLRNDLIAKGFLQVDQNHKPADVFGALARYTTAREEKLRAARDAERTGAAGAREDRLKGIAQKRFGELDEADTKKGLTDYLVDYAPYLIGGLGIGATGRVAQRFAQRGDALKNAQAVEGFAQRARSYRDPATGRMSPASDQDRGIREGIVQGADRAMKNPSKSGFVEDAEVYGTMAGLAGISILRRREADAEIAQLQEEFQRTEDPRLIDKIKLAERKKQVAEGTMAAELGAFGIFGSTGKMWPRPSPTANWGAKGDTFNANLRTQIAADNAKAQNILSRAKGANQTTAATATSIIPQNRIADLERNASRDLADIAELRGSVGGTAPKSSLAGKLGRVGLAGGAGVAAGAGAMTDTGAELLDGAATGFRRVGEDIGLAGRRKAFAELREQPEFADALRRAVDGYGGQVKAPDFMKLHEQLQQQFGPFSRKDLARLLRQHGMFID